MAIIRHAYRPKRAWRKLKPAPAARHESSGASRSAVDAVRQPIATAPRDGSPVCVLHGPESMPGARSLAEADGADRPTHSCC